jgi:hypothetical protein
MSLIEDFPTDPFTPSLRYAATCQLPVLVPWGHESIKLGTSLLVPRNSNEKAHFSDKSAFSDTSLDVSKLIFTSSSEGSMTAAATSRSAAVFEHVNLSIAAQIGGSFIGASGQAKYEKHVTNDNNVSPSICSLPYLALLTIPTKSIKSSLRSNYRSGKVTFQETPRLSPHAIDILRNSKSPDQAFRDEFGVYYLAAYFLGGSNANMLSGSAGSKSFSEDLSGSGTVKVAFFKKSISFEKHKRDASAEALASLAAFDSLEQWESNSTVTDSVSYSSLLQDAAENSSRGWCLANRISNRTRKLGLDSSEVTLSWKECESLCRAGIVVELLLLPYAGLKEYVAAILAGPV